MKPMTATHPTTPLSPTPDALHAHKGLGWGRRLMLGVALTAVIGSGAGCNRYGWELFRGVAELATYVAVTAMVLSWHDHHHHHHGCGHQFVVYESRPVYHYDGRWEYYDDRAETWYYYPDGVPGY